MMFECLIKMQLNKEDLKRKQLKKKSLKKFPDDKRRWKRIIYSTFWDIR